jgi:hypothetical protein
MSRRVAWRGDDLQSVQDFAAPEPTPHFGLTRTPAERDHSSLDETKAGRKLSGKVVRLVAVCGDLGAGKFLQVCRASRVIAVGVRQDNPSKVGRL